MRTALYAPVDGPVNSAFARPDEVDAASRANQEAAWLALSPDKLAFQHCLAAKGGAS